MNKDPNKELVEALLIVRDILADFKERIQELEGLIIEPERRLCESRTRRCRGEM